MIINAIKWWQYINFIFTFFYWRGNFSIEIFI